MSASVDETAALAVKLFGDPLRAEIVGHLASEQLCTCHLVELTGARQPTVSHHLRVLRDAGLVEALPAGRFTYYRLRPDLLAELRDGIARLADRAADAPRRRPCE
jgi:ArsR family transcriptional regulator